MVPTRLSAESCSIATQTPTQAHQLPWAVQRQPRLDPSAGGASSSTRSLTRLFVPLILTGLCVYLLVAYVKFLLRPPGRLYEIFKRLQVTALEYRALGQVLAWEAKNGPKRAPKWRQRNLFAIRLKPLFVGG